MGKRRQVLLYTQSSRLLRLRQTMYAIGQDITIQVKAVKTNTPGPNINTYTGKVLPNPRWVGPDCLCLSTGRTDFPFRIIDLDRIIGSGYVSNTTKTDRTTFIVAGTKPGSSYTVTRDGKHWSCTCVGFGFRKDCKHVRECK